jgi:hypothetical protein
MARPALWPKGYSFALCGTCDPLHVGGFSGVSRRGMVPLGVSLVVLEARR